METSLNSGIDYDTDNLAMRNGTINRTVGYVNAAFMLLFLTIGLPRNAMVIGIVLRKKLFTRPSVMLLLNLATLNMPVTFLFGTGYRGIFEECDKVCRSAVLLYILTPGP